MKILRVGIAMLLMAAPVRAELDFGFAREDGGQAGAFLDYAASVRSMAMGRAQAASADDASAVYSNPSALSDIQRNDIVANYSALFEDARFGAFTYAQPTVDWGTFGLGLISLRSGDYERRDADAFKTGSFQTSELGVLLSHGIALSNRLSLGSGVKIVRQQVDAMSGTGYGLDGGLLYRLTPRVHVGLVLHNVIAPQVTLKKEKDRYPRDARLGAEWQASRKWVLAADLAQGSGRSPKLHLGAEWLANNLLTLRAGINESEITTGVGFKMKSFALDYAFGYQDAVGDLKDLGASHRFGFHMNFGKKISDQSAGLKWQKKGQEYLAQWREKMSAGDLPSESEMKTLSADTKDIIERQGYPKAADLYAAQGYMLFFEGQYERAVQLLSESAVQDPENAQLAQHIEKARQLLDEDQMKRSIATNLKRAKEMYAQSNWKEALAACDLILSLDAQNIEAAAYRDDALKHIKEPIERQMKIATALFERGDYFDAIKAFQRVKEMDPENQEAAHYVLQTIEILEKQAMAEDKPTVPGETARPVYEIERNSAESRALYSRGLVLYSQGKIQEAAVAWDQAIKSDPENALARNALNRAQMELRDQP